MAAQTLTIPDTKNHEDHTLPLSSVLTELLTRRREMSAEGYVFPGEGAKGYLVEPRKFMAKVTQASGVAFTLHDLRRTFITVAESIDIPAYALKRLLNHKMRNDVTAGYIIADVERLRLPMQRITDAMLSTMNSGPGAESLESGDLPEHAYG
jgi:integrase